MLGTKDEAYLIILEITDQAYSPYLSSLEINFLRSALSGLILIFLLGEYYPVSKLIASITFISLILLTL